MKQRYGLTPTFTTKEALARGVHPRELYAWRDGGEVMELSRGVYRWLDEPLPSFPDLLAVSKRAPSGIICCVSAAAVHDLTDEMPPLVQFALPVGSYRPQIDYPSAQCLRFSRLTFELGLSHVEAAPGEWVRI